VACGGAAVAAFLVGQGLFEEENADMHDVKF